MTRLPAGSIDCDVHVSVPGMAALLPYMSQAWREMITTRGTDGLELASYPTGAPLSCRPDWRPATGKPGTGAAAVPVSVTGKFWLKGAVGEAVRTTWKGV